MSVLRMFNVDRCNSLMKTFMKMLKAGSVFWHLYKIYLRICPSYCCLQCDLLSSQAKVNNSSLVGLGYTQTLKPGECSSHSAPLILYIYLCNIQVQIHYHLTPSFLCQVKFVCYVFSLLLRNRHKILMKSIDATASLSINASSFFDILLHFFSPVCFVYCTEITTFTFMSKFSQFSLTFRLVCLCRHQADTLGSPRWQEHQRWGPQARSGTGVPGVGR